MFENFNLIEIESAMESIMENEVISSLIEYKNRTIASIQEELEYANEQIKLLENTCLEETGVIFEMLEEEKFPEELKEKYYEIVRNRLDIMF